MPHGVTVEGLCGDLRRLLANHEAANDLQNELVLLCDLKSDYNDTVEVTLVSCLKKVKTFSFNNLLCYFSLEVMVFWTE